MITVSADSPQLSPETRDMVRECDEATARFNADWARYEQATFNEEGDFDAWETFRYLIVQAKDFALRAAIAKQEAIRSTNRHKAEAQ